ncbi:hypothetical protein Hanom_Chr12g01163611 [Helianthus anomalus]
MDILSWIQTRSTRAGHWWFITLDVHHFGSQSPLKVNLGLGTRNGERRNMGQWSKHQMLLVC